MHGSGAVPGRVSSPRSWPTPTAGCPFTGCCSASPTPCSTASGTAKAGCGPPSSKPSLVQAQLQALKMQLQPHFLFNSMNAVSALMSQDVKAARRMLAQLSQFLRLVLEGTDEQEVTLEQELRLTRLYLEIEQTRFPDRLAVRYDIAPDTEGALLPALLLQPVVENAVRHGLAPRAGAGELAVRAEKQGDRLLLQVQDNGRGAADTAARGIGLRNLESRLATLYGPDYALAVESAPACGYCLRLSIPFRRAAGALPQSPHEPHPHAAGRRRAPGAQPAARTAGRFSGAGRNGRSRQRHRGPRRPAHRRIRRRFP
ncbi:sensor histidine kinase [Hymenobacter humi]|uniref:Sensor histidine kinase n=1 Tax=Hymenobacter humi TaxID=1411620 RepID=A0ABW2UF57_9BACT